MGKWITHNQMRKILTNMASSSRSLLHRCMMLVPPPVATQSSREGGWEGDYDPCRPAVDGRRDKDTQPCANDNTGHTGNTLQVVQHAFVIYALSI